MAYIDDVIDGIVVVNDDNAGDQLIAETELDFDASSDFIWVKDWPSAQDQRDRQKTTPFWV